MRGDGSRLLYEVTYWQTNSSGKIATCSGACRSQTQSRIQDFPEEGGPTPECQHIIWPIFLENGMTMKNFSPEGGRGGASVWNRIQIEI